MSRKRSWGWARRTARHYRLKYAAQPQARRRAPLPPVSRAVESLSTMRRPQAAVCGQRAMPNFAAAGGSSLELIE